MNRLSSSDPEKQMRQLAPAGGERESGEAGIANLVSWIGLVEITGRSGTRSFARTLFSVLDLSERSRTLRTDVPARSGPTRRLAGVTDSVPRLFS